MDRHRATTSTGAVVDQPTVLQLANLVAEVDRSGQDAFLVVERRAATGTTRLEARRTQDSWVLEVQDGGVTRLYQAETPDPALVYSAVAYWVLRARTWPVLAWRRPETAARAGLARAV